MSPRSRMKPGLLASSIFLSQASLAHPEDLVNVTDLTAGDEHLFEEVEFEPE